MNDAEFEVKPPVVEQRPVALVFLPVQRWHSVWFCLPVLPASDAAVQNDWGSARCSRRSTHSNPQAAENSATATRCLHGQRPDARFPIDSSRENNRD